MAIHGWSGVCQSNSGVWGYSDIGGYSSSYPYSDIGGVIKVVNHGWYGHSGVRGYSDIGEYMCGNPFTTLDCLSNSGLQSGGQIRHSITRQEWRPNQLNIRNIIIIHQGRIQD